MFDVNTIPEGWIEMFERTMDRLGLVDPAAVSVFEELICLEIEHRVEAEKFFGRAAAEFAEALFYSDGDQICVHLEIDLDLVPIELRKQAKTKCLGPYKLKNTSLVVH